MWSHLNNHNYILLHPMDLIFVPKCSSLNKLSDGIFDLSIWTFLCQVHSKTVRSPTYSLKKIIIESVDCTDCLLSGLWLDEYY